MLSGIPDSTRPFSTGRIESGVSLNLSRYVNWRIQAHVGSQEKAVLAQ